jgi:hypothetical protein
MVVISLGGYSSSGISYEKSQNCRGGRDYWIIKINSAGVKEWDKRYGGAEDDELNYVRQVSDGYVLGGRSKSGAGFDKSESNRDDNNSTFDYWVVKIDFTGIKKWDHRFGGTEDDNPYAMRHTIDNGFIIGGYSNSPAGGDKTQGFQGGNDYWIVKIDSTGGKSWDARYGGGGDDHLYALTQTAEGGYLLGGRSKSGAGNDKTQTNYDPTNNTYDYWIVKTDSTGAKKWDARYGGLKNDVVTALQQTSDGGMVVGGYSFSGTSDDKSEDNWDPTLATHDFWLIKFSVNNGLQTMYPDADNDGYGNPLLSELVCSQTPGYVSSGTDCNDNIATIHPGASDICNNLDDNCDGVKDEHAITATITPSGNVTICKDASLTLVANNGSAISYQWQKNGVDISGATNASYVTSKAADYKVNESNTLGCTATSPVTTLVVATNPPATITALGNLDICITGSVILQANTGTSLSYKWLKGGNEISGETNESYTATKGATYKVVVTNSSGCTKTSPGAK